MKWKWLDFDHQLAGNDTYLSYLLSSGQNNDIIGKGQHAPATPWRAAVFGCTSGKHEKRILNSHIRFEVLNTTAPAKPIYFQAGKRKGWSLHACELEWVLNISITAHWQWEQERADEQEVQQALVLDTVGAALRGDMSAPVLHEEVSENISNRTNNNTGNIKSERWAEATWHINQRVWGKAAAESYTPAGTKCAWAIEEAEETQLRMLRSYRAFINVYMGENTYCLKSTKEKLFLFLDVEQRSHFLWGHQRKLFIIILPGSVTHFKV